MQIVQMPGWQSQHEWYESEGRKVFPRPTQWQWFYRRNKLALARQGAIAFIGRTLLVNPEKLVAAIETVAVEEALRRALDSDHPSDAEVGL
jgi:hypothetical protein